MTFQLDQYIFDTLGACSEVCTVGYWLVDQRRLLTKMRTY